MKELVIVPAWRRPDFLLACLQRLQLADDGRRKYLLALDRGHTEPVRKVVDEFAHSLGGRRAVVLLRHHEYEGNSYNTLMSYADAIGMDVDLIYLVEDDVFVGLDFFSAHRQAHDLLPLAFAVGGCNLFPGWDPTAVTTGKPYHSLGVSFRPHVLERYVWPHITEDYFHDRVGYGQRKFGGHGRWEQDGLIEAVRRGTGRAFAVMDHPRAYHAGYTGYTRVGTHFLKPEETCDTHVRHAAQRLLTMSAAELNERACFDKDHHTVDLDAPRRPISRRLSS